MKVVVTDYFEPDLEWEREQARARGIEFECFQLAGAPIPDVIAATRNADVVVVNRVRVTPELVTGWQKCRLVIRHGVGYDSVDVGSLKRAGIELCYIPDYCTEDVAEHAVALLLACGRKLPSCRTMFNDGVRRGRWDFTCLPPLRRIAGQTVGIIGCGRIGSRVYQKMQSFGVNFLICDPYLSDDRRRELRVSVSPLQTVLGKSDFITVHVPLTSETRYMINRKTLSLMKPAAYLVNTSRGGVVDSRALVEALRDGTIAGAGVDVFEQEPPSADDPLPDLPNVIVTPHAAWYSEEAAQTIRELIMLEVGRFADGLPPRFSAP